MEKEKNLEQIIEELLTIIKDKKTAIYSQQYETAARLRDEERLMEKNLYNKIFGRSGDYEYDTNGFLKYDCDFIQQKIKDLPIYFKENFDVTYPLNPSDGISVLRQIKLKKLGI